MTTQGPCLAGCGRDALQWHLCWEDGRLLAGACYGKTRWRNPNRMRDARGLEYGCKPYRCLVCTRWHLGHRIPETAEVNRARVALIRQLRAAGNGWLVGWLADQWDTATRADRIVWKMRGKVRA